MSLLERSKLYKDVWSRPCTKIAAELGISSSALKRICTEMDIPTPVAGYWTRVQCGKKVSKDPLPKARRQTIIPPHFSVKEAVFPWNRFPGIDTVLGPEMKSTGEVMGIDPDWGMA